MRAVKITGFEIIRFAYDTDVDNVQIIAAFNQRPPAVPGATDDVEAFNLDWLRFAHESGNYKAVIDQMFVYMALHGCIQYNIGKVLHVKETIIEGLAAIGRTPTTTINGITINNHERLVANQINLARTFGESLVVVPGSRNATRPGATTAAIPVSQTATIGVSAPRQAQAGDMALDTTFIAEFIHANANFLRVSVRINQTNITDADCFVLEGFSLLKSIVSNHTVPLQFTDHLSTIPTSVRNGTNAVSTLASTLNEWTPTTNSLAELQCVYYERVILQLDPKDRDMVDFMRRQLIKFVVAYRGTFARCLALWAVDQGAANGRRLPTVGLRTFFFAFEDRTIFTEDETAELYNILQLVCRVVFSGRVNVGMTKYWLVKLAATIILYPLSEIPMTNAFRSTMDSIGALLIVAKTAEQLAHAAIFEQLSEAQLAVINALPDNQKLERIKKSLAHMMQIQNLTAAQIQVLKLDHPEAFRQLIDEMYALTHVPAYVDQTTTGFAAFANGDLAAGPVYETLNHAAFFFAAQRLTTGQKTFRSALAAGHYTVSNVTLPTPLLSLFCSGFAGRANPQPAHVEVVHQDDVMAGINYICIHYARQRIASSVVEQNFKGVRRVSLVEIHRIPYAVYETTYASLTPSSVDHHKRLEVLCSMVRELSVNTLNLYNGAAIDFVRGISGAAMANWFLEINNCKAGRATTAPDATGAMVAAINGLRQANNTYWDINFDATA